eukprot:365338-Chlamydomonas_euryale.AAC.35
MEFFPALGNTSHGFCCPPPPACMLTTGTVHRRGHPCSPMSLLAYGPDRSCSCKACPPAKGLVWAWRHVLARRSCACPRPRLISEKGGTVSAHNTHKCICVWTHANVPCQHSDVPDWPDRRRSRMDYKHGRCGWRGPLTHDADWLLACEILGLIAGSYSCTHAVQAVRTT